MKRTQIYSHLSFQFVFQAHYELVAVLFVTLTTANPTNIFNWTTCEARPSMTCNCTSENLIDVIARCQFHQVTDLRTIIDIPRNLIRL